MQGQKLITSQLQMNIITPPPSTFTGITPTFGGGFIGLTLPLFNPVRGGGGDEYRRHQGRIIKRKYKYTPTLTGIAFGGKIYKGSSAKTYTGLETRPSGMKKMRLI